MLVVRERKLFCIIFERNKKKDKNCVFRGKDRENAPLPPTRPAQRVREKKNNSDSFSAYLHKSWNASGNNQRSPSVAGWN